MEVYNLPTTLYGRDRAQNWIHNLCEGSYNDLESKLSDIEHRATIDNILDSKGTASGAFLLRAGSGCYMEITVTFEYKDESRRGQGPADWTRYDFKEIEDPYTPNK